MLLSPLATRVLSLILCTVACLSPQSVQHAHMRIRCFNVALDLHHQPLMAAARALHHSTTHTSFRVKKRVASAAIRSSFVDLFCSESRAIIQPFPSDSYIVAHHLHPIKLLPLASLRRRFWEFVLSPPHPSSPLSFFSLDHTLVFPICARTYVLSICSVHGSQSVSSCGLRLLSSTFCERKRVNPYEANSFTRHGFIYLLRLHVLVPFSELWLVSCLLSRSRR